MKRIRPLPEPAAEQFRRHILAERGEQLSTAALGGVGAAVTSFVDTTTFKSYWSSFRGYMRWCASEGVAVRSITADELTGFVAYRLHKGSVTPSTVAGDLSGIRKFADLLGW